MARLRLPPPLAPGETLGLVDGRDNGGAQCRFPLLRAFSWWPWSPSASMFAVGDCPGSMPGTLDFVAQCTHLGQSLYSAPACGYPLADLLSWRDGGLHRPSSRGLAAGVQRLWSCEQLFHLLGLLLCRVLWWLLLGFGPN